VKPPFPLGLEFSGEIRSAPESCEYESGDRVFGDWLGSYSTVIAVPMNHKLYRIPKGWSYVEAAGLAATLPVSYGGLVLAGGLGVAKGYGQEGLWGAAQEPRRTILVHAAAGGLGIAAVQIAAALGHRVIGTAGSVVKCRMAESLGAEVCIDYQRHEKWWDRVNELTDGRGADLVYDTVGLVGDSIKCLAHRGKVLVIGFAGREGNMEDVKMNRVLLKQASLIGYVSHTHAPARSVSIVPTPLTDKCSVLASLPDGFPPRKLRSGRRSTHC
jgi:NADPH:quinone reductase